MSETVQPNNAMNEPVPSSEATDVQELMNQIEEWKDLAMRRAAELENFRKRAAQEKENLVRYASEHLITRMLPVVDDLHNAVEASKNSGDVASLREGIQMIYNHAVKIMSEAGVHIIESAPGEPFNVDVHEALMHMPSDVPEGHIVQQVQRGYQLHDKVLRHAKVITSAGTLPEHTEIEDRTA